MRLVPSPFLYRSAWEPAPRAQPGTRVLAVPRSQLRSRRRSSTVLPHPSLSAGEPGSLPAYQPALWPLSSAPPHPAVLQETAVHSARLCPKHHKRSPPSPPLPQCCRWKMVLQQPVAGAIEEDGDGAVLPVVPGLRKVLSPAPHRRHSG